MKIFRNLDLVESMGTGIIRILESYDKDSFEFFPNFIRVSFPFNKNEFRLKENITESISNINNLSEIKKSIITLIEDSPTITQSAISTLLDVNIRTIQRNIKELVDLGYIERIGSTKKGEWKIINKGDK